MRTELDMLRNLARIPGATAWEKAMVSEKVMVWEKATPL